MVFRLGRYKSIGNVGNGGGRVNSNGHGNKQNQGRNFMFLQQENNGGNSSGCIHEDYLVPGKYGST